MADTTDQSRLDKATADAQQLLKVRQDVDLPRLDRIRKYLAGEHDPGYVPNSARSELREMVTRSVVNLTPLIVATFTQALYVDGYRHADGSDDLPPWQAWQANRMDARQTGLHAAALAYGAAYLLLLPGRYPVTGQKMAVWEPLSPRMAAAFYADPVQDEWPAYLLVAKPVRGGWAVRLVDQQSVWHFSMASEDTRKLEFVREDVHGLGICPAVRYTPDLDLDGRISGEVEPLIVFSDQINETTFNLKTTETFAAFPQKWATGIDEDDVPWQVSVARLIRSDSPDAKFGQFAAAELRGYLESRDSTARYMASSRQFPPHHMLGSLQNISAEALAAAEVQKTRKDGLHKIVMGESHEQAFRLSGLITGDTDAFTDVAGQVVWRDVDNVSLGAVVDAWGKVATMLDVPVEMLWEKIPGWTQTDVERAKALSAKAATDNARLQATAFGMSGLTDDAQPA